MRCALPSWCHQKHCRTIGSFPHLERVYTGCREEAQLAQCSFHKWEMSVQSPAPTEKSGIVGGRDKRSLGTDRQSSWVIRHQVRWEILSQKLMRRAREETSSQEHLASTCVCSSPFYVCVQRHMVSCERVWLYVSTWMVESMDLRRCWHRN